MLGRDKAARLPAAGDLPALQPLLALPVVRDRDLHRRYPQPRRVLLLVDPPTPVLTNPDPASGLERPVTLTTWCAPRPGPAGLGPTGPAGGPLCPVDASRTRSRPPPSPTVGAAGLPGPARRTHPNLNRAPSRKHTQVAPARPGASGQQGGGSPPPPTTDCRSASCASRSASRRS